MPTLDFLKQQFPEGYDSGDILANNDHRRLSQEKAIGGSYTEVFAKAIIPYIKPDSIVLELGAGAGSWSRAILSAIPNGFLHATDLQDITQWLSPEQFPGRLQCHQVSDNDFSSIEENTIDFFWSFGVLCHNNKEHIHQILQNSISKLKPGAYSAHQYGDWDKLETFGWQNTIIPKRFKQLNDNDIWWPRNDPVSMVNIAKQSGWMVHQADMDLLKRDSIILLQKPISK